MNKKLHGKDETFHFKAPVTFWKSVSYRGEMKRFPQENGEVFEYQAFRPSKTYRIFMDCSRIFSSSSFIFTTSCWIPA